MSISRKENGSLVKKAGRALVDLALNLTSNNAIANSAVSEGMTLRNVTLYNGKLYQLNLDGTRGDEISMSKTAIPDFKNKVNIPSSLSSAPSDGYVTATSVAGKGDMFFVEGINPVGRGFVPVKQGDAFTYGQYYGTGVGVFYPVRYFS